MMKKWIATALACSVFALSACGGQQQESTQNAASERLYTVAMNAEFAPFEFMDANNNIEGFDVDLMNAMAKQAILTLNISINLGIVYFRR